ncbi:molecular chaperone [Sutterella massiliensis]|uniref:Molecular chaperone n=1 Tax=Sutterella massiliensis TaxID=1816689 RepID=A0ABS2DQ69_9BURK|nr:molecular chaperone [Sutterella massiliensis]
MVAVALGLLGAAHAENTALLALEEADAHAQQAALERLVRGIGYNETRVVIEKGRHDGSLILKNTSEFAFLVQSYIETADHGERRKDFLVTPPLAKLLPGKNTRVRVTVTDPASLPQDRESMFWLYTRAIPSKVNDRENRLNINFVMRLKVFYRPKGMKGTMREAIEGLEWSWTDGGLVAKNASPFHISLASLTVNGVSHEVSDVIAPFASMTFDAAWLPKGKTNEKTEVVWRAVSDLGGIRTGEADVARGRN